MVRQYHQKRDPDSHKESVKFPLPQIQCRGCGIFFTPTRKDQVYHSTKCRVAHYQETGVLLRLPPVEKTCAWDKCGATFKTTSPVKQRYCCSDHRIAHWEELVKGEPVQKQEPQISGVLIAMTQLCCSVATDNSLKVALVKQLVELLTHEGAMDQRTKNALYDILFGLGVPACEMPKSLLVTTE